MKSPRSNNREIEVSLLGTIHRRMYFFAQYIFAKIQFRTILTLLPIVEDAFRHPWVAKVELRVRFWPGRERLWPWNRCQAFPMHWDAPITISVFRNRRGKRRQALCMSLYVIGDNLYIKQLQGVSQTNAPSELRAWPKMFIEACRMFAKKRGFKTVRVPRSNSLYSYHNPGLNTDLLPDARERAVKRIRRDMEFLYDKNALELDFVPDGYWFKWINPKAAPCERE